jgi:hypothetical protein
MLFDCLFIRPSYTLQFIQQAQWLGGKAKACSASRSHTHPPNSSIQLKWCTARGCEPQTVLQAHARGYRTPRQAQAVSNSARGTCGMWGERVVVVPA